MVSMFSLEEVKPRIVDAERCWIAAQAAVIGNVEIGLDVSIWFHAVIRGDNEPISIGDRSNVQDGSVLHTDPGFPLIVGKDVTIGHRAILHGCTIGDGSLIGMGAVVLNGAKIGKGCLVGANALVPQGAVIPDGMMVVGTPAKVVRLQTPEEIDRLKNAAMRYVSKISSYRSTLKDALA